jgi:hypothetical protein
MKTKLISLVGGVALLAGITVSPAVYASESSDVNKALAGSTVLELPAKAADLVAQAPIADRQRVAVEVIKAAVGLNPSAAIAVVSTVVRENPATAPGVTLTAMTLQHERMNQIIKAAVAAAPSEASDIVAALLKGFPQDYGVIAVSAASGSPSSGREILAVVADYVPALQDSIQNAAAQFASTDGILPVQAILTQSYGQAVNNGSVTTPQAHSSPGPTLAVAPATVGKISPPTLGPPFTPVPGTMSISVSQTQPQVPGGRVYSSP